MRERTPSDDDTPARTTPTTPTAQTSSEGTASTNAVLNHLGTEVPIPCREMVASSHSLEELGATRPSVDRGDGVVPNENSSKTARLALDKRSRLSNVINNLRKKVPPEVPALGSSCAEDRDKTEVTKTSVERNLETLGKYVMTVLNGVIADVPEKDTVTEDDRGFRGRNAAEESHPAPDRKSQAEKSSVVADQSHPPASSTPLVEKVGETCPNNGRSTVESVDLVKDGAAMGARRESSANLAHEEINGSEEIETAKKHEILDESKNSDDLENSANSANSAELERTERSGIDDAETRARGETSAIEKSAKHENSAEGEKSAESGDGAPSAEAGSGENGENAGENVEMEKSATSAEDDNSANGLKSVKSAKIVNSGDTTANENRAGQVESDNSAKDSGDEKSANEGKSANGAEPARDESSADGGAESAKSASAEYETSAARNSENSAKFENGRRDGSANEPKANAAEEQRTDVARRDDTRARKGIATVGEIVQIVRSDEDEECEEPESRARTAHIDQEDGARTVTSEGVEQCKDKQGAPTLNEPPDDLDACKNVINDLLCDVNRLLLAGKSRGKRQTDASTDSSRRSLHCSLPLDKVGPILRTCKAASNDLLLSSSSPQRSPSRPSPPTVRHLCLYCDRKFISISLRQRHTERVHQIVGSRRSERTSRKSLPNCQYCSEKGDNSAELSDASSSSSSSSSFFDSGAPDVPLDTLDGLFRHMAGQHADKYYACVRCSTRYSTRENLTSHTIEAHGENSCPKSLASIETLSSSSASSSCSFSSTEPPASVTLRTSPPVADSTKRTEEVAAEHPAKKEAFSNPGSPDFDSTFYSSVSCNIRENLLHHIDGKLEAATTPTSEPKAPVQQVPQQHIAQPQLPIDISLTAATPVYTKEYQTTGGDQENSSEYAQRPGKTRIHPRRVSFEKYNFPRKYDGREAWTCSVKDLSKFDISTQLTLRKKRERGNVDLTSAFAITSDARILTKRPTSGQTELNVEDSAQNETNVASVPSEDSSPNSPRCSDLNAESNDGKVTIFTKEFANFMRLERFEDRHFQSIGSSCDVVYAELTGEWSRPRIYICGACGARYVTLREMEEHKASSHPNVWCSHFEFAGDQRDLYKHLFVPGRGTPTEKARAAVFPDKICTKCSKNCNTLAELHRHMLECGGDQTWLLGLFGNGKKKCKWRPFGSRSRRRRQRGMNRNIQNSQTTRANTPKERPASTSGPRVRPSDRESIQKMLANLPPKRASRKVLREENFARSRTVQTRSRPRIALDASTSAMQSRNKRNLKNKLLKNAKSFQRNRSRIDNITAAIESVVKNSISQSEAAKTEPKRQVVEAATRSKLTLGVLSKKKNVKTKNSTIMNVEHPRTRRRNPSGLPRVEIRLVKEPALPAKIPAPKASSTSTVKISPSKTSTPKSSTPRTTTPKVRQSKALGKTSVASSIQASKSIESPQLEDGSRENSTRRKKSIDALNSLNASIKAKQQPRAHDGKFTKNSAGMNVEPSRRMQTRRSNPSNGQFLATSRIRATREFNRRRVQARKRMQRLSSDNDKMPTLEPAVTAQPEETDTTDDIEKSVSVSELPILSPATIVAERRMSRSNTATAKKENTPVESPDSQEVLETSSVGVSKSRNCRVDEEKRSSSGKPSPKASFSFSALRSKTKTERNKCDNEKVPRSKGAAETEKNEEAISRLAGLAMISDRMPRRSMRNSLSREEEEQPHASPKLPSDGETRTTLRKSTRNLSKSVVEKRVVAETGTEIVENDRCGSKKDCSSSKVNDDEPSTDNSLSGAAEPDEEVNTNRESSSKKGGRCLGKRRGRIKKKEALLSGEDETAFEEESTVDDTSSSAATSSSFEEAKVNLSIEHLQQLESGSSNVDSGKENSLETSLNLPKPRTIRPRKSKGVRPGRERLAKRSLGGVIGILTEGVNIPVEAQQSVVLTVQMPVVPSSLDPSSNENEARTSEELGRDDENQSEANDPGERDKENGTETINTEATPNSGDTPENNGEQSKPSDLVGKDASEVDANTKSHENVDSESSSTMVMRSEIGATLDQPSNDIIMDLSKRRPRKKGSFLEKIVSKIAKQKDVSLLEGDVGTLLDTAAEELTNILDEVSPNFSDVMDNDAVKEDEAKTNSLVDQNLTTPIARSQDLGDFIGRNDKDCAAGEIKGEDVAQRADHTCLEKGKLEPKELWREEEPPTKVNLQGRGKVSAEDESQTSNEVRESEERRTKKEHEDREKAWSVKKLEEPKEVEEKEEHREKLTSQEKTDEVEKEASQKDLEEKEKLQEKGARRIGEELRVERELEDTKRGEELKWHRRIKKLDDVNVFEERKPNQEVEQLEDEKDCRDKIVREELRRLQEEETLQKKRHVQEEIKDQEERKHEEEKELQRERELLEERKVQEERELQEQTKHEELRWFQRIKRIEEINVFEKRRPSEEMEQSDDKTEYEEKILSEELKGFEEENANDDLCKKIEVVEEEVVPDHRRSTETQDLRNIGELPNDIAHEMGQPLDTCDARLNVSNGAGKQVDASGSSTPPTDNTAKVEENVTRSKKRSIEVNTPKKNKRQSVDTLEPLESEEPVEEELFLADILKLIQKPTSSSEAKSNGRRRSLTDKDRRENETTRPGKRKSIGDETCQRRDSSNDNSTFEAGENSSTNPNLEPKRPKRKIPKKKSLVDEHLLLLDDDEGPATSLVFTDTNSDVESSLKKVNKRKPVEDEEDARELEESMSRSHSAKGRSTAKRRVDLEEMENGSDEAAEESSPVPARRRSSKRKSVPENDAEGSLRLETDKLEENSASKVKRLTEAVETSLDDEDHLILSDKKSTKRKSALMPKSFEEKSSDEEDANGNSKKMKRTRNRDEEPPVELRSRRKRNSKRKSLAEDHLELFDDDEEPALDVLEERFKIPLASDIRHPKSRRTTRGSSTRYESGNEESSDFPVEEPEDNGPPVLESARENTSKDSSILGKRTGKSLIDEHLALPNEEDEELGKSISRANSAEVFGGLEEVQISKKRTSANFTVGHTKTGEILIVEKKKKLTKEVAKFFCEVCATSFTRKSSLKKHNSSQSHLSQVSKSEKLLEAPVAEQDEAPSMTEEAAEEQTKDEDEVDDSNIPADRESQSNSELVSRSEAPLQAVTPQISEEDALEEELLDEEICKITENMTHDDFVLTDHVTPEVPLILTAKEITSGKSQPKPKKNMESSKSHKLSDNSKLKKRNLAEEHLDLDSPSPSSPLSLSTAPKDEIQKSTAAKSSQDASKSVDLSDKAPEATTMKVVEAAEPSRFAISLPISIVATNPAEFSVYSKSKNVDKFSEIADTKSMSDVNKPMPAGSMSPDDSSTSDKPLAEILKSSATSSLTRVKNIRRSLSSVVAETPKSPPKTSSDSPKTGEVPAISLDFLNIAEKLKAPDNLVGRSMKDSAKPIGTAVDFDSDDSTMNTRISDDIQKLINDPELSKDQRRDSDDEQPRTDKKKSPQSGIKSRNRSSNRFQGSTERKRESSVKKLPPTRLDSSDDDDSEVDAASETKNKNKIVKTVFGRVFAGAEKAEKSERMRVKVKEVLDDWESRSEEESAPRSPSTSSIRRRHTHPKKIPEPQFLASDSASANTLNSRSRRSKKQAEARISKTLKAESAQILTELPYSLDEDDESKMEVDVEATAERVETEREVEREKEVGGVDLGEKVGSQEWITKSSSLCVEQNGKSPSSTLKNRSTVSGHQNSESSGASDSEDDVPCGRLSPTFVCNTPVDTSDSFSDENDTDVVPAKATSFISDKKILGIGSPTTKEIRDVEPKVVTIAPDDAVEDNAIDVPRNTHHPLAMTPQKPRQPKVLNFDEELFVECCSRLKATTENELRGAKKIEIDHTDMFHGKGMDGGGRRLIRDRWRDVESQNSLGSLLDSVNQLLGEEMYSNVGNEDSKLPRDLRSENSSRSGSPDIEVSGPPDNPAYEDSLDVAFEHNNKLRDKIQQRMRESENLITTSFVSDVPAAHPASRDKSSCEKTTEQRASSRVSVTHDEPHSPTKSITLDSAGFKHKMTSTLGGLLDKALSNLLHNTGKHDHNGSTPMKVLAELACARAPTSTVSSADSKTRDRSSMELSLESPPMQKDVASRKVRNPIRELFERKKELNERSQSEKTKAVAVAVAALKELNVQRQRKTTKKTRRRRQEFPLVRKNLYDNGMAEKKKRREMRVDKKEEISTIDKVKDVYDFDDEESRTDVDMPSYRSQIERTSSTSNEIDVSGITSRTIIETLENGKEDDFLGRRLESMIDRKFKEFEKSSAPKTKGALKAFQNDRNGSKEPTKRDEDDSKEKTTQRGVSGPMDEFVERKQHKKTSDTSKRSKSKKRNGKNSKKKSRTAWYENDSSDEFRTAAKTEDVGVGKSKSQRTCSKGKQNLFAELSSTSSESEPDQEMESDQGKCRSEVEKEAMDVSYEKGENEEVDKGDSHDILAMGAKKTRNYSETKKSESEMSDHPLIIDERRDSDDDSSVKINYEPSFEMDDLYREDSSDEEEEPREDPADLVEEVAASSTGDVETILKTKYLKDDELIPLEEALDLLDQPEMMSDPIPTAMEDRFVVDSVPMQDDADSKCAVEDTEDVRPTEVDVNGKVSPVLPEKLSTNEKPSKESENLPLHVFLSRKVQESKKRKQQHLKKLQEEQQRILLDLQPTRRQRKCAIGKQGLLAEISSSEEDAYEGSSGRKSNADKEGGEKGRRQKRESREKRKERYIEKKHEQIIAKEQKAIQEEILREISQRKNANNMEIEESESPDQNLSKVSPKKPKKSTPKKSNGVENSEIETMSKIFMAVRPDAGLSDRDDVVSLDSTSKDLTPKAKKSEEKKKSMPKKNGSSNGKTTHRKTGSRSSLECNGKDHRRSTSARRDSADEELRTTKSWNKVEEGVGVAIGRRKRAAANQLYYWSSSSDEEEEEVDPVATLEEDEERQEQHGWIVGDSHKRMITMLAMEKQLKEKRRRSEDEFDSSKTKMKKHRNSTS